MITAFLITAWCLLMCWIGRLLYKNHRAEKEFEKVLRATTSANRVGLNPAFGLSDDIRQNILREAAEEQLFFRALGKSVFKEERRGREDIEAKIEAWHTSDYSGPLHEYLGMTEAEYAAFVEQREDSGIVEKLPSATGIQPGEPA